MLSYDRRRPARCHVFVQQPALAIVPATESPLARGTHMGGGRDILPGILFFSDWSVDLDHGLQDVLHVFVVGHGGEARGRVAVVVAREQDARPRAVQLV